MFADVQPCRTRRVRSWRAVATALMLGALIAVVGCGGDDEPAGGGESLQTVPVGTLPIANAAPMYLGMEQGFFEEEGIEIEPVVGEGGSQLITQMVADETKFAFIGYTPAIVARSQGLPVKLVSNADNGGTSEENAWQVVVVGGDSPIREPQDLAGQTIAVNALRGVAEVAIKAALEQEGVDPDSVELLEVPFPEMPAALEEGRVDAIYATEPFVTPVLQEGGRIPLAPYITLGDQFPNGTYATTEQVIAEEPELVEGFARAMNRSLEYATENPQEARDIITTYTEIPPEVAQEIRLPQWPTEIDREQVEELIGYAEDYGVIEQPVQLEELLWEGVPDQG